MTTKRRAAAGRKAAIAVERTVVTDVHITPTGVNVDAVDQDVAGNTLRSFSRQFADADLPTGVATKVQAVRDMAQTWAEAQ